MVEEEGWRLILEDVKVMRVPVMLASSERFKLRWTMVEVVEGWDDVSPSPVLAAEPSPPASFSLSQNFPNPFNPVTTIRFSVPEGGQGKTFLRVHDIRGRRVRTLVDEPLEPGPYRVQWDGRDEWGGRVASGVYFYTLRSGGYTLTRKMQVLK